jgi:hypothetical protein
VIDWIAAAIKLGIALAPAKAPQPPPTPAPAHEYQKSAPKPYISEDDVIEAIGEPDRIKECVNLEFKYFFYGNKVLMFEETDLIGEFSLQLWRKQHKWTCLRYQDMRAFKKYE